jgi:homoserine dehydrogenase
MKTPVNIGLFGFGVVGQGFYNLLKAQQPKGLQILKIAVKDPLKKRNLSSSNFVFNEEELLFNPNLDLIVEVTNDPEAAYRIVKYGLQKGIPVVSASKKMLAGRLEELVRLSKQTGTLLLYEASVAAAIPVIQTLENYFDSEAPTRLRGIINGTTNYILSLMKLEGLSFEDALKLAQNEGFAESDPSSDVDGWDAAFKLSILNLHAFGVILDPLDITRFGIRNISSEDVEIAKKKNAEIKLLAVSIPTNNGLASWVLPSEVNNADPISAVKFENNAIELDFPFNGNVFASGKGAGSFPTGSAVLKDVIQAARNSLKYNYNKLDVLTLSPISNEVKLEIRLRNSQDKLPDGLYLPGWRKTIFESGTITWQGWIDLNTLRKYLKDLTELGFSLISTGAIEVKSNQLIRKIQSSEKVKLVNSI